LIDVPLHLSFTPIYSVCTYACMHVCMYACLDDWMNHRHHRHHSSDGFYGYIHDVLLEYELDAAAYRADSWTHWSMHSAYSGT